MLRKLYRQLLDLAAGPRAEPALAAVSFAESSFFPLPPDLMLGPMAVARPEKWARYALVCTIASVLGGLAGYAIGFFLFESIGKAIVGFFGYGGKEAELRAFYDQWGVWFIFLKGLTPIPYKLVTIISGAMAFSIPVFIAASAVTRGIRFFAVAWVFKTYGPAIAPTIEKRIGAVTAGLAVLIVGGLVAARMLH
jgi:membrane protein YqaA with SNARE-associated domain